MRRRLLIIYKDPEFGGNDGVVLGQCEPFTAGWKLLLVTPDGQREIVLNGTYADLRKVQEACAKDEDPDAVRRRVKDLRALMTAGVTETVVVQPTRPKPRDSTRRLAPVKASAAPWVDLPPQLGDGVLELGEQAGVVTAFLADPHRGGQIGVLPPLLATLFGFRPRAIVLDLGGMQELSAVVATELQRFSDQCVELHVVFGLCTVSATVRQALQAGTPKTPPAIYASVQDAVRICGQPTAGRAE